MALLMTRRGGLFEIDTAVEVFFRTLFNQPVDNDSGTAYSTIQLIT